jgi:(p)ppGpp synthase/HD superfamily hydrolase
MPVESAATASTGSEKGGPPPFARSSPLLMDAYALALEAHHGSRRRGETDIDHPVAVASVLHEYGIADEEMLAAAFLHDVIEDTRTDAAEIGDRFGERVRLLVEHMTEDSAIAAYPARKAEHRRRVAGDSDASAIYAADKLASTRAIRRDGAGIEPDRLEHYLATQELLREAHPELPMLDDLNAELEELKGPNN